MYQNEIEGIKRMGKEAPGRKELLMHLNGVGLTIEGAILAKCYECTRYYTNRGPRDCKSPDCPLYSFMPYSKGHKR